MAETAFEKTYRQEYIAGFEFGQSMLRTTTVTEFARTGNEVTFLVADSGDAEAKTRGVNGRIPSRGDNNQQLTATLVEWHDLAEKTGFNIFASQGNQVRIMQDTTLKVMNKKIDDDIIGELSTATVNTGAAATASLSMVARALSILGTSNVPTDEVDNMFGLISPAANAYLIQTDEFSNAEWVDVKPLAGPVRKMLRWAGVNWIIHPRVPGVGTNAEKLFVYHRNAIGHACDMDRLKAEIGRNAEQDYSWARVSNYMGSKLLQNSGVVVMNHDGSAMAAA